MDGTARDGVIESRRNVVRFFLSIQQSAKKNDPASEQLAKSCQRIKDVCFYDPNFEVEQIKVAESYKPPRDFIERIKRSYRRNYEKTVISEQSMWSWIDNLRRPLHEALLADDDRAEVLLQDPGSTYLLFGLDESFTSDMMQFGQANDFDKLVRLSEALGCRRTFNPDTSDFLKNETPPRAANVDHEVDRICKAIGLSADAKFAAPFRGTCGISTKRGLLDQRTIQALYQAHRVRALGGSTVLEIGAGVGRTAFYALALGATSYSIVDIPLTMVCQALFLGAAIGEGNVRLAGEADAGQKVQLFATDSLPEGPYDMVLNADSLSEMAVEQAKTYVEYIRRVSPLLLSINHEANPFTVASLLPPTVHRHPYWLRKGYVEEMFIIR
ncbi:putative sugar O-methyltransferase [Beijerinckia sp. L45]|uniref:putative sugar O-methyltransferase n=1 Tax=Beijerinckia sp. L45 TaxID=1641855 RepID=UPI00131BDA2D|nr:putative sugar O-methyltransferase [Beijerinckia sp. L45]